MSMEAFGIVTGENPKPVMPQAVGEALPDLTTYTAQLRTWGRLEVKAQVEIATSLTEKVTIPVMN